MGLSRNKVAVGEPAAGSPPFEGEESAIRYEGVKIVVWFLDSFVICVIVISLI